MEEMKNAYKISVRKPMGTDLLRDLSIKGK
jgi:hypothetical protein